MEDYFVIILTLVIAVVGVIRGKKKKKAPNVVAPEGASQNTGFWDMIMDNQNEIVEDSVSEIVAPDPASERFEHSVVEPKYTFSATNEGTSDLKEELKETVRTKSKVMIEGEEFSLRKAVIYSEIMNRKYS